MPPVRPPAPHQPKLPVASRLHVGLLATADLLHGDAPRCCYDSDPRSPAVAQASAVDAAARCPFDVGTDHLFCMADALAAAGIAPQLRELARRRDHAGLKQQAEQAKQCGTWQAITALEHACVWLLAGDAAQADRLVLEADELDPSLALIPDVWGLWPSPPLPLGREVDQQRARLLLVFFRRWRSPNLVLLWPPLLEQLQTDWPAAIEPEAAGDLLQLFGYGLSRCADINLTPAFEPSLATLVDDAAIAAHPAAACRFWQLIASIRPQWVMASIRAADLSLGQGKLESCRHWLEQASDGTRLNPWYHDIAARCHLELGDAADALACWAQAIQRAQAEPEHNELVSLFEQRRREARRGPAVLQVRRLANRGDITTAHSLLEQLLVSDPQWEPLLSLREMFQKQAQQVAAITAQQPAAAVSATMLLDRAEARLAAWGVQLPALQIEPTGDDHTTGLEAWSLRLSDYEARFALA